MQMEEEFAAVAARVEEEGKHAEDAFRDFAYFSPAGKCILGRAARRRPLALGQRE